MTNIASNRALLALLHYTDPFAARNRIGEKMLDSLERRGLARAARDEHGYPIARLTVEGRELAERLDAIQDEQIRQHLADEVDKFRRAVGNESR